MVIGLGLQVLGLPAVAFSAYYIYRHVFKIEGKSLDKYQVAYMLLLDTCVAIFLASSFSMISGFRFAATFLALSFAFVFLPIIILVTLMMIITILITLCCARSERLLVFLSIVTMMYLLFVWPPLFPLFHEAHSSYHIMSGEVASFISFGYSAICILLILNRARQRRKI